MKQNHLAKLAGLSPKHVSDLKVGRRKFTRERADQFEEITGILSYKWTYPDKFGDPWKELKKVSSREPPPKVPSPPGEDRRTPTDRRSDNRRQTDGRRRKVRRGNDRQADQCLTPAQK